MKKVLLPLILSLLFITTHAAAEEDGEVEATTSAYVSLGDALILNLSSDNKRLVFLQITADILIADSNSEALIKTHIPAIRHELIVLLSEQKDDDMKSPTKREEIRNIATAQVQDLVKELADNRDVEDVLFSSFLIQ